MASTSTPPSARRRGRRRTDYFAQGTIEKHVSRMRRSTMRITFATNKCVTVDAAPQSELQEALRRKGGGARGPTRSDDRGARDDERDAVEDDERARDGDGRTRQASTGLRAAQGPARAPPASHLRREGRAGRHNAARDRVRRNEGEARQARPGARAQWRCTAARQRVRERSRRAERVGTGRQRGAARGGKEEVEGQRAARPLEARSARGAGRDLGSGARRNGRAHRLHGDLLAWPSARVVRSRRDGACDVQGHAVGRPPPLRARIPSSLPPKSRRRSTSAACSPLR